MLFTITASPSPTYFVSQAEVSLKKEAGLREIKWLAKTAVLSPVVGGGYAEGLLMGSNGNSSRGEHKGNNKSSASCFTEVAAESQVQCAWW